MRAWLKRGGVTLLFVVVAYAAVLVFPRPLFAYHLSHGAFELYSDRPIPAHASAVLDDAALRLAKSELNDPGGRYSLFVCNDNWRLALLSQRFGGGMAGVTDTVLTARNIFLRRSDFQAGQIIPARRAHASLADRPLAYYVAHEATHVLEARSFGRGVGLRYPRWLVEGYADYVGKAGQFDAAENRRALLAGDPAMNPRRSGLYRRYHLEVLYMLERRHVPLKALFAAPPPEADVIRAIAADAAFGAAPAKPQGT